MLFPFTHAWTRRQKWLIVLGTAALGVMLCALGYAYERYYGLPSQDILVGTWEHPGGMIWDPPEYYELHTDHTISWFVDHPDGPGKRSVLGRWYAFGPNIYIVFPKGDEPRLMVWHIVDISDDALRIWSVRRSYEETLRRVNLRALSQEEQTIVGTWQTRDMDSPSYMIVEPNHKVQVVSSDSEGKDPRLVGTGKWTVAGDDLAIELLSFLDTQSPPQKSASRMKIADFLKDKTRYAPVKYRIP